MFIVKFLLIYIYYLVFVSSQEENLLKCKDNQFRYGKWSDEIDCGIAVY
jgi:hypothetical protein